MHLKPKTTTLNHLRRSLLQTASRNHELSGDRRRARPNRDVQVHAACGLSAVRRWPRTMNSHGHLVTLGSARSQTEQSLKNLELLLSVHDFSIAHVWRLVLYVVGDKLQLEEAWSAVAAWFSGEVPPATLWA